MAKKNSVKKETAAAKKAPGKKAQNTKKTAATKAGSPEANLKRLAKTSILANFVKKNNGVWNHQQWLELCAQIEAKGYAPVDLDQVGLLLEEKKAAHWTK